jgi:hypothetical protein
MGAEVQGAGEEDQFPRAHGWIARRLHRNGRVSSAGFELTALTRACDQFQMAV